MPLQQKQKDQTLDRLTDTQQSVKIPTRDSILPKQIEENLARLKKNNGILSSDLQR